MTAERDLTPEQIAAKRAYNKEWKRRDRAMFPDKYRQQDLTPEQIAAKKEWKRRDRAMYPDKYREEKQKWCAKNPDKVRRNNEAWLARASDETKERMAKQMRERSVRYYRKNKELIIQKRHEYRARNPERVREWERRSETRRKLRQEPKVGKQPTANSATEAKTQLLLQNMAFAAAIQHVPRHLPQDMRDDLISDIVVACLESKIRVEDVKKNVPKFIAAHNKAAGYNVSLDAEIGDGMRMIDLITEDNLPW